MLRSHVGAARFAWNWGLARCQQRYQAEGRWYSGTELHKLWNAGKKADPALAWWAENSKCVYQEAFRDLDRALRDFIASKKGQRKGRRLGVIRTHESTRKLTRCLQAGTARILSATVSRTAGRWFGYKTAWNGGSLLLASRWFPSSKTCSGCGAVKAKLALSEGTYRCDCGLVTGRDVNAAANLLNLAASGAESLNACGGTVRPGLAGHVPVNQEPGTAPADQTGTASGQPLAAEQELTHAH
jgi:transposase